MTGNELKLDGSIGNYPRIPKSSTLQFTGYIGQNDRLNEIVP